MSTIALAQTAGIIILPIIGWFAGTYESALQEFSISRLEDLLEEKKRKKNWFLNSILKDPQSSRLSAAFLSTLCYGAFILLGVYLCIIPEIMETGVISGLCIAKAAALILTTSALRSIAEATGEMTAEKMVLHAAIPAWLLTASFKWLNQIIIGLQHLIARGAGVDLIKSQEELEEEVIAAVNDGELAGVVNLEQRKMIERVFDFVDTDVADIFTPRTEMVSVEQSSTLSEAINVAIETGHSRLPLFKETRDHISGIFYVRDALKYIDSDETPELSSLMRKPLFVPETKSVVELLKEMQRSHTQIAIVLDEYGGTAGLVTIEDVIEEIVGEIHDEYDNDESPYFVKVFSRDHILVDGHVHVSDVNQALDDDLIPENDDYETIGGFVLDNLGHIPRAGEEFIYNGLMVKTVSADERRVRRVEIRRESSNSSAE